MARLVKRKKRRLSFLVKCLLVFVLAICFRAVVSITLGSKNTSLTIEIQKMRAEVSALKLENQQLNIDIQTLQNKDRIYTMASDAGLEQNQENVVSISKGAMSE